MNNVVLIGRVVKDPELRYIAGSGTAVSSFTLAVDKGLSREKKQEMESKGQLTCDFINIVVWGKSAENCANFLSKGKSAGVQGRIQTRSYDAKDGTKRYMTEIVANSVEFLDKKSDYSELNDADLTENPFDNSNDNIPF